MGILKRPSRSFYFLSDCSYTIVNYISSPHHSKGVTVMMDSKTNEHKTRRIISVHNLRTVTRAFYQNIRRYVLNNQMLLKNAFPLDSFNKPGIVRISEYLRRGRSEPVCLRCNKMFFMFNEQQFSTFTCQYHPGEKIDGSECYQCCGMSQECCYDLLHVPPDVQYEELTFLKTHSLPVALSTVFSLDTEMCITKKGYEVAKITIIDHTGDVVYDTFVLPKNPVVDHNTKYSGITAQNLEECTTTLEDVQAVILSLIDASSILIGHGLENDLRALQVIHRLVVDTAVLFPDPRGYPFKRSLKAIVAEYLQCDIQCGLNGHNSVEDAKACMSLMKSVKFIPRPTFVVPVLSMPIVPIFTPFIAKFMH